MAWSCGGNMKKKDRKYLRKWRRQDRKQRGDWTWGDLWRWIKGGMK